MGIFASMNIYGFLNGKKIFEFKYDIKQSKEKFDGIIPKYLNLVPKDAILLAPSGEQKKISEITEKIGVEFYVENGFHFYSDSLYKKSIIERKKFPLVDVKILKEDNSLFSLNKNPQQKNNDINYIIAIFGEEKNNHKLMNGFLYYLIDMENIIDLQNITLNDKHNLINKYIFETKEGNYKFILINIKFEKGFFSDKETEQVIQLLNDEKINFFIFNIFETHVDSLTEKIVSIHSLITSGEIKDDYLKQFFLFIEPNPIIFSFMSNQKSSENFDKYYNYFPIYLDSISDYNSNLNVRNICLFNQAMIGFSTLYELITKNKNKVLDFSTLKLFWSAYISEIEAQKQKNISYEKENKEIKEQIEKIEEINLNIQKQYNLIEELKKRILKHEFFLIPISSKYEKVKYYDNRKTNICKNCKFNCHENCDELLKTNCQCFNWSFICKICPNRCKSKYHEVVNFSFPKYEYKTIDQILDLYHLDKSHSVESKISSVLQKLEKDKNENKEKIKSLEKKYKEKIKGSISYDDIIRKGFDKGPKLSFKGKEMKVYELLFIFLFKQLLEGTKFKDERNMHCNII